MVASGDAFPLHYKALPVLSLNSLDCEGKGDTKHSL